MSLSYSMNLQTHAKAKGGNLGLDFKSGNGVLRRVVLVSFVSMMSHTPPFWR